VKLSFAHAEGRNYRQLPARRGGVRSRRLPISSILSDRAFLGLHVIAEMLFSTQEYLPEGYLIWYASWQRRYNRHIRNNHRSVRMRQDMDLWLELRRTSKLVVASPKGDLVSFGFLSRHFRAGLWILPSLPGLVCGNDLWKPGDRRKVPRRMIARRSTTPLFLGLRFVCPLQTVPSTLSPPGVSWRGLHKPNHRIYAGYRMQANPRPALRGGSHCKYHPGAGTVLV
jgi:hypothetical protein